MKQLLGQIGIAGAGIMGLNAAHALRERQPQSVISLSDTRGFPPLPCASLMAGGMLAPWSEIEHLPPGYFEAAQKGIRFWESLPREKTGFARNGSLLLAHKEDQHMLERFAARLAGQGNAQTVGASEIAALEPALAGRFEHGIYLPDEAFVHPVLAIGHMTQAISPRQTQKLEIADAKKFDWLVDCRGYAAAQDDPELRGVKGEIAVIRNRELKLNRPVRLMHPRYPLYIVPRPDHEFMIGATLIENAQDSVSVRSVMELLSAAYTLHSSFGEAEIMSILAGIRPAYPDNLPRITVEGNVIRCNGLFRHGYLLAPIMAECVADYIGGRENEFMHLFKGKAHDDRHHQRTEKKLHSAA